jgi:NTE family protein
VNLPYNKAFCSTWRRLLAAVLAASLWAPACWSQTAVQPGLVHATSLEPQPAHSVATTSPPRVTVVLAGGGAKGFAHLALLRRLEQDHIPIAKIIGTSMGAVIGSLYASGMDTTRIEKVIASLDPGRIALDQLDRTELPHRSREYQQRYPVELELGVKNGALTFARGVSDGQRFLTLMQELTANVAPNSSFDQLKIPFRAVATRYRDGELISFDHGNLALVVRASMAAPGVFAPVEIEGETYVDGGLVANLPVEVALREGADVIVASYLGDSDKIGQNLDAGNALSVANRMLDILMRQNERRNIALLRPQDILVRPQLQDFGFGSFDQPEPIIQAGVEAVQAQDNKLSQLAALTARAADLPTRTVPDFTERQVTISQLRVTGTKDVTADFIEREMQSLLGKPFKAHAVSQKLDALYASGNFERLNYHLAPLQGDAYELVVDVNEKTYGPNFLKTSLGFYSEGSGTNLFSFGVGYRRPWLTPSGLELQADVRAGSQSELALSLYQPLGERWGVSGFASYNSSELPLYRPGVSTPQKMASSTLRRQEVGLNLSYDLSQKATAKIGVVANNTQVSINTARIVGYTQDNGQALTYTLNDGQWEFAGLNAQFTADLLDSPSFATRGYYINVEAAQGVTGVSQYTSFRANGLWARSFGPHVVNLGVDLGADHIFDCSGCSLPTSLAPLYLGGFQSMGAYQMGQLSGDRLVHVQGTYMYRLSDGGILRQPTFVGFVAEAGDAWLSTTEFAEKYSGTVFIGVDSKIGDVFLGFASGSGNNRNIFLQLGRRFSLW